MNINNFHNSEDLNIFNKAKNFIEQNKRFAVSTVISTWGSSPRPIGSQMLVSEDNEIVGSVSGGCIEGSVIQTSLDIINGSQPRVLNFGVSDEKAWEVGLTCGGKISVYVERDFDFSHLLDEMIMKINSRTPFCIIKDIKEHKNHLYLNSTEKSKNQNIKFIFKNINLSSSGMTEDKNNFVRIFLPKIKIIIIGAVHIAQHLETLCRECGFFVDIIDPRETFATKERFKIGELINLWPEEYFERNIIDERTAVVLLTHDPKIDDQGIHASLNSNAFYIGCLGSKRTHLKRLERLKDAGFNDKQLNRIHGPIGLDISAKSPAEISVSIMAQIIQIQNKLEAL